MSLESTMMESWTPSSLSSLMCKVVLSPEGKFVGRFRAEDNCEVYLTTETSRDKEDGMESER